MSDSHGQALIAHDSDAAQLTAPTDGQLGNSTHDETALKVSSEDGSADTKAKEKVDMAGDSEQTTNVELKSEKAGHLKTESSHVGTQDSSADSERRTGRLDIENEASAHLARRAAGVNLSSGDGPLPQPVDKEADLPEPPPPPTPPEKDAGTQKGKAKETIESADNDQYLRDESDKEELPAAPQGIKEQTGAEIENIMHQFEEGQAAPGEAEIMSPRLERQQPILQLPPRSSSLEAKDKYMISPIPSGESGQGQTQSQGQYFSGASSDRNSIISARRQSVGAADDTASITSHRTSIFQPPPPSPDPEPALPFDFHRFLEQLRHRTADPVARFLRSFLQEFGKKQWMVHEQVKIIGDFLEFISKKMAQCEVWRTVSDAEFDNAREGMEKLVMNRLYTQTFSPALPAVGNSARKGKGSRPVADAANPHGPGRRGQHQEDVERDDVIAQKIGIYGWIKEEHLDIKQMGDKGRKFLTLAQQELLKINTYRAPRDKVICVLNCCKVIFGFLKNSKSDQSADAFVPLLIYTVLRARPEHLVSNVQYIWRFRNQDKLGGEAGYYMSSLMGVVTFLENLDRTMISISDEEFEKNVEQAVSAIAEGHKAEEYEEKPHTGGPAQGLKPGIQHMGEKSAISRPEVTPRNSMDGERSSPRKSASQRLSEKSSQGNTAQTSDDDSADTVTGILRTIQKPLSSIGRIFSDEGSQPQQSASSGGLRPGGTPPTSRSPRALSPAARLDSLTGQERRSTSKRRPAEQEQARQQMNAAEAAARQASVESAQAQQERARGLGVVVETLQGMFPNLDKEVIEDVVRAQEGNVGRAVDACLALSDQG